MINYEQTGSLNATRTCCYGSQRPLPPKSLRGQTPSSAEWRSLHFQLKNYLVQLENSLIQLKSLINLRTLLLIEFMSIWRSIIAGCIRELFNWIRDLSNSITELCKWISLLSYCKHTESSLIELNTSVIELESSVIELESSAIQLERSLIQFRIS